MEGLKLSLQDVARLASAINTEFCDLMSDPVPLTFDELPPNAQHNMTTAVYRVVTGQIKTAEESHEQWVKSRKAEGWTYGKKKSNTDRTHPNLCPYLELPTAQQFKDELFMAVCNVCAPYIDYTIEPFEP